MFLLLALACSTPEPGPPSPSEMVGEALPSVVLVVADRGAGTGYGAGSILTESGLVVTNLHVVEGADRLRVMFHDPDRTSYSPLDGGLSRYLFEYEDDLVGARLVRGEPTLDLAVIKPRSSPEHAEVLPLRETAVDAGDAVYALGHPKESVWSFTAGVVSARHQGVIQHDAAVNQGNSGGPLVDAWGRMVGVNTMKLFGDAEGMAFARPVAYATALVNDAAAPVAIDRTSPASAMMSCEHAIEIAPTSAVECFDWSSAGGIVDLAAARAAELVALDAEQRARLEKWVDDVGRDWWIDATRKSVLSHLAGTRAPIEPLSEARYPKVFGSTEARDAHVARRDVLARLAAEEAQVSRLREERMTRLVVDNGLQIDLAHDSQGYRDARRMGIRVEEVHPLEDRGIAWILVGGRNVDGTPYRNVECWAQRGELWEQPFLCAYGNLDSLPAGWPKPVVDEDLIVKRRALTLAHLVLGEDPWKDASEPAPLVPSGQTTGDILGGEVTE